MSTVLAVISIALVRLVIPVLGMMIVGTYLKQVQLT